MCKFNNIYICLPFEFHNHAPLTLLLPQPRLPLRQLRHKPKREDVGARTQPHVPGERDGLVGPHGHRRPHGDVPAVPRPRRVPLLQWAPAGVPGELPRLPAHEPDSGPLARPPAGIAQVTTGGIQLSSR